MLGLWAVDGHKAVQLRWQWKGGKVTDEDNAGCRSCGLLEELPHLGLRLTCTQAVVAHYARQSWKAHADGAYLHAEGFCAGESLY